MISIYTPLFNPQTTQSTYNKVINAICLDSCPCPSCEIVGQLIRYGTYNRSIKASNHCTSLRIARTYCKNCKHTHALLPSSILPYYHYSLLMIIGVLSQSLDYDNSDIDESTFYRIRKAFKSCPTAIPTSFDSFTQYINRTKYRFLHILKYLPT